MDRTHVQMLLASAGYYAGAIDGIAGPETMTAVEITEAHAGDGSGAGLLGPLLAEPRSDDLA